MSAIGLRFRSIASLVLTAALACGAARAAAPDPETPDYLLPDSPGVTIETHRDADGRLQIDIQGGHFDGRPLIERMLAAIRRQPSTAADADIAVHIAVGALAGFNREVLYDVDMRLSRRAGRIEDFALTGSTLDKAKVRGGVHDGAKVRRTLFLDADDAGAFLRFVDLYGKLTGGRMWLALELPALRDGLLTVADFDLPDEPVLAPLRKIPAPLLRQPQDAAPGPSRLRGEFALSPGRVVVKDLMLVNKAAAVTMDGLIVGGELRLRGILVPAVLYEPHDPPCSSHLCLRGMPYSVTGPVGAPRLVINPFPGPHLRALFPR